MLTTSTLNHITIVCCPKVLSKEEKLMRKAFPKKQITFLTTEMNLEQISSSLLKQKTEAVVGYSITQGIMQTLFIKIDKAFSDPTKKPSLCTSPKEYIRKQPSFQKMLL